AQASTEKFWRRHCFAVAFTKQEPTTDGSIEKKEQRKVATYSRCHKVMYPGKTGSPENHKKGYCSDGFKQKATTGDDLPPWPQPAGIFTGGSEFHPLLFLAAVRDVYEKVVMEENKDVEMEHEAFLLML
ncbi:hypothetical protein C8R44DRAFT_577859, partial [Mycena epipterygia]